MEPLQLREKEIFDALEFLQGFEFVVIGGYAVNCYAPPRFSVDCDIVVKSLSEGKRIAEKLRSKEYKRITASEEAYSKFLRYEKTVQKNFTASMDIMAERVIDRQTNASFEADWVFENSAVRMLIGKTIPEKVKLRVANAEALIVMKLISSRNPDIRDVFMLFANTVKREWIKAEVSKRCNFTDKLDRMKKTVSSPDFKNNLQGVYGYLDNKLFEKHLQALMKW